MYTIEGKYTTALVTNDNIESEAIQQITDNVNCPAYSGQTIVIQPDAHAGKNSVIGFCSTVGNYVNPSTVGVDIGCSISMRLYDKPLPDDKKEELNHKLLKDIGWGFNTSPSKVYDEKELYRFLSREFSKAKSEHPDIFSKLPDTVTEKWISDVLKRVGMNEGLWYKSINSVGGGNHYIEYDVNEEASLYGITVHCGSRNFGVKVCNYWESKAEQDGLSRKELKELTRQFKEEYKRTHDSMDDFQDALNNHIERLKQNSGRIKGFLTGDDMNGYFCDMLFAMAYAKFNHITIHRTIDSIVVKYGMKPVRTIASVHNYIDFSGDTPVIRKGAIRAYRGEEMLVPFNMRDGVAICDGLSNETWLNSCAHGAGRKMSRSKAKETLSMEEFSKQMDGIYSTTVCKGTLDESPMAYKDTDEILSLIKETCEVKHLLRPVLNVKATDGA